MKIARLVLACLSLWLSQLVNAQPTQTPLRQYDFQYQLTDDRVQVFDDGISTRIQIPEGMAVPTVLAVEPSGQRLLELQRKTPYLIAQGVFKQLVLRWPGRREAIVTYVGSATGRNQQPASFGSIDPQTTFGKPQAPVLVATGGSDSGKSPVLAQGQAVMPPLPTAKAVEAEIPATGFTVMPDDKTLSKVLARWARAEGMRLDWKPGFDIPLATDRAQPVAADLNAAIRSLTTAVSAQGGPKLAYALSATKLTVEEGGDK